MLASKTPTKNHLSVKSTDHELNLQGTVDSEDDNMAATIQHDSKNRDDVIPKISSGNGRHLETQESVISITSVTIASEEGSMEDDESVYSVEDQQVKDRYK